MTGTDRQGVNAKKVGGPLTVSKGAEDFSLSFGFPCQGYSVATSRYGAQMQALREMWLGTLQESSLQ